MAAYPSYTIGVSSRKEPEPDYLDDFDNAGGHHSQQKRTSTYYAFRLVHPGLTMTQFRALEATYEAGPRDTYTLTYYNESPAVTYDVLFVARPRITKNHGDGKVNVEVMLRGKET